MTKITQQEVVDSVAQRWESQYRRNTDPHKLEILEKLKRLLPPINPEEVNQIISNRSWTTLSCDQCRKEVTTVVQVGQEPDYGSSTAQLCLSCLKAAVKLGKT